MTLSSYKKGLWAEYFCIVYLFFCGYRVLARRYRTPLGEVDIIASKGKDLVFIEVKARGNIEKGSQAVSKTAMQRIENAAKTWLAKNAFRHFENMHFDVLVVTSFYKKPEWYKNAWQTEGFSGRI